MEQPAAAAWAPCEFQLANWSIDQEPAAAGLPAVEYYASIDIPAGTCCLEEASVPDQYYYYSAASQHNATSDHDQKAVKISNDSRAQSVAHKVMGEFKEDIDMKEVKMHRYPACLVDLDESYTVPRIVAIGPYHHGKEHLKPAEKVKHVAACHCVRQSGRLLEELYGAFLPVADYTRDRHFYDRDVMAGINHEDFRHMMFFDACFLVQYMLIFHGTGDVDESLNGFLRPNRSDIFHDVMLLENQLPWHVVETVVGFMRRPKLSKRFVRIVRTCMLPDDHSEPAQQQTTFIWYDSYRPPHLLGLVRYHIVGRGDIEKIESQPYIKYSFSAMELAEIGITLSANKTMQLLDMRLNQEGTGLFPELSLAPLSLDRDRASYLVNMAALELCTVQSFMAKKQDEEDSAVCSYLLLLAKLVYREEDVHELRVRGLLLGGGGLTNEEALRFFTGLQGLRRGPYYFRVMDQIQIYRGECKGMKTKLHGFFHNHKKTIAAVASGVVSVGGIIGTLLSIKNTL